MKKLILSLAFALSSFAQQAPQPCNPFRQTDCVLNGVYIPPPPPARPPAPPQTPAQCDPAKTRTYNQLDANGLYPQYGQNLLPLAITGAPPAYNPPYWPPNYFDSTQIMANYQAWVDWNLWATEFWPAARPFVVQGYPAPAYILQRVASNSGEAYCFQGVTYTPQPVQKGHIK